MRYFLTIAVALLAALPASAAPAPFPPCREALPAQVKTHLAEVATDRYSMIRLTIRNLRKEKDEQRRAFLTAQLKGQWRAYFRTSVRALKSFRDLQEKTILGRRLSEPEIRAINRAITDYERQWADAVRKGSADPPDKPAKRANR
jgi:hypothetical protein